MYGIVSGAVSPNCTVDCTGHSTVYGAVSQNCTVNYTTMCAVLGAVSNAVLRRVWYSLWCSVGCNFKCGFKSVYAVPRKDFVRGATVDICCGAVLVWFWVQFWMA